MPTTPLITVRTRSGRMRRFRSGLDHTRIVGLDADGRVVVNDFDAFKADRASRPVTYGGITSTESPFLFGLTLCCNASDTGTEDGVVCRACYGTRSPYDEGAYLFMNADRAYDLDPAVDVCVGPTNTGIHFVPVIPDDAIAADAEPVEVPSFAEQMSAAGF